MAENPRLHRRALNEQALQRNRLQRAVKLVMPTGESGFLAARDQIPRPSTGQQHAGGTQPDLPNGQQQGDQRRWGGLAAMKSLIDAKTSSGKHNVLMGYARS